MQPSAILIFSSLVYSAVVCFAAPTGDNFEADYEYEYEYDQTQDADPASAEYSESVAITPPGEINVDALMAKADPRDEMLTPFALSTLLQIDPNTRAGLGMHFGWRSRDYSLWQADFIINKDMEFRSGIANYRKSRFSETIVTFWKWGFSTRFIGKQQLASFLNTENYFVRLGIGTENEFSTTRVRLETEVFTSFRMKQTGLFFIISYLFSD